MFFFLPPLIPCKEALPPTRLKNRNQNSNRNPTHHLPEDLSVYSLVLSVLWPCRGRVFVAKPQSARSWSQNRVRKHEKWGRRDKPDAHHPSIFRRGLTGRRYQK